MNEQVTKKGRRMPQLDGLRAIAVFLVFCQHWDWPIPAVRRYHVGPAGVQLFFVLSGFLITGILLAGRGSIDVGHQSATFTIRQFYLRRFLRIFPLYYTVLFVLSILGLLGIESLYRGVVAHLGWHLFYISNVWGTIHGHMPEWTDHFWTLAVEEQFYLFWPFVILLVPRRWVLPLIMAVIGAAIVYRGFGWSIGLPKMAMKRLPFSYFTSLGGGALLAYAVRNWPKDRVRTWLNRLLWVGLPLMVVGYVNGWPRYVDATTALTEGIGTPLVFCWLIYHASCGFDGVVGAFLAAGPMRYLGRISYGLYVIHYYMKLLYKNFSIHILHLPRGILQPDHTTTFLLYTATTVVLASLSWHFLEAPLNGLKRRFPYRKPTAGGADKRSLRSLRCAPKTGPWLR